jgi:hypothetical protein
MKSNEYSNFFTKDHYEQASEVQRSIAVMKEWATVFYAISTFKKIWYIDTNRSGKLDLTEYQYE